MGFAWKFTRLPSQHEPAAERRCYLLCTERSKKQRGGYITSRGIEYKLVGVTARLVSSTAIACAREGRNWLGQQLIIGFNRAHLQATFVYRTRRDNFRCCR